MGEYVIKLPDVGEGVAEAEIVEWEVAIGDVVQEDMVLAAVMTDKATVEIPSPVDGRVIWLGAEPGDIMSVGAPIIRLEVSGEGNVSASDKKTDKGSEADALIAKAAKAAKDVAAAEETAKASTAATSTKVEATVSASAFVADGRTKVTIEKPAALQTRRTVSGPTRAEGEKPLASPSVRKRAKEAGVDLRQVPGTGPAGRISHEDLDAYFDGSTITAQPGGGLQANTSVTDIKVVGLRRKIAEKMSISKSRIPHITIVEEVDMTALEELRGVLNKSKSDDKPKLTLLPFLMRSLVKAVGEQPALNAIFDDEAGVIHQYGGVHIGMAAQTPNGLVVPVIKHAEARDIWGCAAEVNRLAAAAKSGTATREELGGSTITITSLGPLGAIATTPVINHPEVAIIGVNKMAIRPMWDGTTFVPRKMMNISASFDHRVIDGWDAAVFVQKIKSLLESPAMIFMEG
ncbi:dihydrolipoamide acetyltransferase family protein [Kiloniella laminariae]|uniref:Dihydrolipoamide acetyltransferase component of pyruvate dehydrogenase complex n=1 Tax=Kiloniella laminariae TaxID=454162 RepID=A0ABT4LNY9_9PROT|nr:dihydrolipoamide acetyltransferase family protein [Kiloniella laminariae]MCZ4282829.1 dihydrolipoamide acetyltransferase family protein [Kiloniella laminariae]